MKKVIITILIMLIILGGCFIAYKYFTKTENNDEQTVIEGEQYTGAKTKLDYSKDGLRVDSSTATEPLTTALMKGYYENDNVSYTPTKTDGAYTRLINNEVDVIIVTEPSADEKQRAKSAGLELEVTPVVNEGFVFFVNKSNKVENLTLEQVQKIYSGEIKNWSLVGGDDSAIEAYQRPENSGSQTGMLNLVMKGKTLMKAPEKNMIDTMEKIVQEVANFDNQVSGIGYSYYYYVTQMFDTIDKNAQSNIKLVSINGVNPSYETIQNKTYPINTAYYIVTRKGDNEEYTKNLVNYMLSAEGKKIAENEGYIPVK